MRLWHWAVISSVFLIASMVITQKEGYYRAASILRKITGIICSLVGLFFSALGLIYVRSDILAMLAIKTGNTSYAEGPGLGLMIGVTFILFIATPLIMLSVMLFKFKNKQA